MSDTPKLSSKIVERLFDESWHPGKLDENRDLIKELLQQLPDDLRSVEVGGKGGCSVSVARFDRHGRRWARNFFVVENLLNMGMGLGMVESLGSDEESELDDEQSVGRGRVVITV